MFRSKLEKDRSVASDSRISPEVTMSAKTDDTQTHEVVLRDSRLSPRVRQLPRERVDSGYEASPSSTPGCCVFDFDDVESTADQERDSFSTSPRESSDHVSRFQSSDVSSIDIDSDHHHHDSFIGKCESSSSWRTYRESPPIPIPSVVRGPPELESTGFHQPSSPRLGTASVPIASTAQRQSSPMRLSSMLNPLSWPTFRTFISSSPIRLPSAFGTPPDSSGTDRSTKSAELEDSFGLDDQAEDVFDDNEDPVTDKVPEIEVPNFEACIAADDFYQLSPEVSLMSPSPPFISSRGSSGNVRRNRSVSVNLPVERDLEQVCQDIGQTLRRLSDQFSNQLTMKRTSPRGRSNTISGCSRSSSPTSDKSKDRSVAVPEEGCSRGSTSASDKDHPKESQKRST